MSDLAALPPHLKVRYGVAPKSKTRQMVTWMAILLVAVGATWWLNSANTPKATGRILTFRTAPDHMTVEFETSRPTGHPSICVLRAQDRSGVDVGYATVGVPSGAATVTVTYELRTLTVANLVEVLGCAVDPALAKVAPPAFPPGLQPPAQPWTPR